MLKAPSGPSGGEERAPVSINSKQPLRVRTFLKVYMELGSYFLFLQEQIKDIIIFRVSPCRSSVLHTICFNIAVIIQLSWLGGPLCGLVI